MEQPLEEAKSPAPRATKPPSRWSYALLGGILLAVVAGAYWLKTGSGPEPVRPATVQESPEALMKTGLDLLHSRNDPAGAAAQFRRVLALNPTHYGATYQLAVALDRSGKPDEARQYWEKMLPMAEAAKDDVTVAAVRRRLGVAPPTGEAAVESALMKAGLDALYEKRDPNAAAAEFRKVLERNPTHYGATYQLATALDRAGKPAEARPLWEKVVKMAEAFKDQGTLATARARLAQKP